MNSRDNQRSFSLYMKMYHTVITYYIW